MSVELTKAIKKARAILKARQRTDPNRSVQIIFLPAGVPPLPSSADQIIFRVKSAFHPDKPPTVTRGVNKIDTCVKLSADKK
jgi:hypothetical protein